MKRDRSPNAVAAVVEAEAVEGNAAAAVVAAAIAGRSLTRKPIAATWGCCALPV